MFIGGVEVHRNLQPYLVIVDGHQVILTSLDSLDNLDCHWHKPHL